MKKDKTMEEEFDDGYYYDDEYEQIELTSDDGIQEAFYIIDTITYNGKTYQILQPVNLDSFEDLEDDQAFVFEVNDDTDYIYIDDDKIVDAVFEIYTKSYYEDEDDEDDEDDE